MTALHPDDVGLLEAATADAVNFMAPAGRRIARFDVACELMRQSIVLLDQSGLDEDAQTEVLADALYRFHNMTPGVTI